MSDDTNNPELEPEKGEIQEHTSSETPTTTNTDQNQEEVDIEVEDENVKLQATPHDDFDWSVGNRHTLNYEKSEIDRYLNDYDQSLSSITENEVVKGKVSSINDGNVLLDLNYKSDGLVSLTEFRDTPDLKVGDHVEVYIETKEDSRGQLVLSRKKAKLIKAWEALVDSHENGTIIKGQVVSKTKGGLIADVGGLETFLPGSQIDIKPIIDYDSYVGKTMELKVVKINEVIKNAVVSHKALIESDLAEQREMIISGLEKGQVLEGLVKNITDFGAFMDLGGVDGLLYITDISWGRINHPNEVLELNQKLNVVVLDFDDDKKRISLGLKQLQPHPWEVLQAEIAEGSTIKGKIVNIEDYGAFLEIIPGVEGLIHVSEVTWSNQPVNAREFFFLGQEFEAKVVTIDRDDRKMSLSIKQLLEDPWVKSIDNYLLNSSHKGIVKNLTPYGVFVELQEGIGGMIHISDLSWTKRYSHPSEFTKVGEEINVAVIEIDKENRKLSLGHKQLEENPWDTFETVFPVGSYHDATVVKREDRGAIVQLPYGLEAFAPYKHIKKEDGKYAEIDESVTVKVIEFNRDDKRIIVSHLKYLDDIKREAEGEVNKQKEQDRVNTVKAIKRQNEKSDRTTLGDLNVFSEIQVALSETPKSETPKSETPKPETTDSKTSDSAAAEKIEVQANNEQVVSVTEEKEATKPESSASIVEENSTKDLESEPLQKVKEPVDKSPSKSKSEAKDDLKKIEGIGPKISQILTDAGIATFEQLSKSSPEKIREILIAAGSRYKMFDPSTWPEQATIAAAGDWDKLKQLQDDLDGGRR